MLTTSVTCTVFLVNVFTRRRFSGNPSAVVVGADDLPDSVLHNIVRELNAPEAAFILEPAGPDHDMRVRFFTLNGECPFLDNATIAAQYVWAHLTGIARRRLRQYSAIGLLDVEVRDSERNLQIAITQPAPSVGSTLSDGQRDDLLDALGLSTVDLRGDCPLQIMTRHTRQLCIGLRTRDSLDALKPDKEKLRRLTAHVGADGYLPFVFVPGDSVPDIHTRLFRPATGAPEDAASADAHGLLGAYLIQHGLLDFEQGVARFRGHQSRGTRGSSAVHVELRGDARDVGTVTLCGDAVIVFRARLPISME